MSDASNQSLKLLIDGNRRFSSTRPSHPNQSPLRRREVCSDQRPFCAVLSCSDSRVPPEIIFDAGLGDIFTVRLAGHVIDSMAVGSIEYAVAHLHVPLIVVLGHSSCGAVAAALTGKKFRGHVDAVCEAVRPAIQKAASVSINDVAKAHALLTAQRLAACGPFLSEAVKNGHLEITAAFYDLKTGEVEMLQ
jgi:carbonic anhydrase